MCEETSGGCTRRDAALNRTTSPYTESRPAGINAGSFHSLENVPSDAEKLAAMRRTPSGRRAVVNRTFLPGATKCSAA